VQLARPAGPPSDLSPTQWAAQWAAQSAALWAVLQAAGDEAVLPAGACLAHEAMRGQQCYAILQGEATAEVDGLPLVDLPAGSFVGSLGPAGRPAPPSGVTVRVRTPARVLVFQAARLAAYIDVDPRAAAAWRLLSQNCH
jgi:hypothetical protein